MRILHLDPDDIDNPLSGGGPVRTFEIYRRLARRHEVTVLTPTFPGSTPEKIRDGVRYLRLGQRIGNHGSSHHITFFFALPMAVRRHPHDVLVEDLMPPMSATLVPLVAQRPLIASVQWFFARTLTRQYRMPFTLGERHGAKLYRNAVVLTGAMKRLFATLHPHANTVVIPNGVDDSLFDMPSEPGEGILYLGRIDFRQKGLDLLLQAYARLPIRPILTLAGHGYESDQVRTLARRLGILASIRLPGRVDAATRALLLRSCRFVCVPSRDETFGMVITEACAAAKPVVLFDKAPMNEVAAPGACALVPPFDIPAFAAAMQRMCSLSDAGILALGATCRTWARQYRWDKVAAAQESFYEGVVAAQGGT